MSEKPSVVTGIGREGGQDSSPRLTFLSTSGAAKEKGLSFPGEESQRRLTVVDLHRMIEDSIPRLGSLALRSEMQGPPESGNNVMPLFLCSGLIDRHVAVGAIGARTAAMPLVWTQGANDVGKSTLAGLIAQARGVDLLKHRIAALAETFATHGAQIIVSSNHRLSPALLQALGAPQTALVDAPYFKEEDVRELVAQHPAPPQELIDGWARLVWIAAALGHPLLTVAKIASLRARGWPVDALLEDLGPELSEAVQLTRQEARRRLLAELPSKEARQLLERVSTVSGLSRTAWS